MPKSLAHSLGAFDFNGDGTVDPDELAAAAQLYDDRAKSLSSARKIGYYLAVCLLMTVALSVGLMFAVVELTKELSVSDNGKLQDMNGNDILVLATSDDVGYTADGEAYWKLPNAPRSIVDDGDDDDDDDEEEEGEEQEEDESATDDDLDDAVAVQSYSNNNVRIEADLPDDILSDIEEIRLEGELGGVVSLRVLGYSRAGNRENGQDALYVSTTAGEILITDDGAVGVSGRASELAALLERAGVELEDDPAAFGSRRHLMGDGSRALLSKKKRKGKNKGKSKKVSKNKCRRKWYGDGICDTAPFNNNRKQCKYDGGDCCMWTNPSLDSDALCKNKKALKNMRNRVSPPPPPEEPKNPPPSPPPPSPPVTKSPPPPPPPKGIEIDGNAAPNTCSSGFYPACGGVGGGTLRANWPSEAIFDDNDDVSDGASRVLSSNAFNDFDSWAAANPEYDPTPCINGGLSNCCLVSERGLTECPVPYNEEVLTVTVGERLTLRLPASPCNADDLVPVSGYNLVTAETVVAHQVSICNDNGERYGCVHIDGLSPGPASWLSIAYYAWEQPGGREVYKQGACSMKRAFQTSTDKGFNAEFGSYLDEDFGATSGEGCCVNAVMYSLQVVEPTFSNVPAPVVRADVMQPISGWTAKTRLLKGSLRFCEVTVKTCAQMTDQFRKILARSAYKSVVYQDVWVECGESPAGLGSSDSDGFQVGGCFQGESMLRFEIYMKNTLQHISVSNFKAIVEANSGTPNPTGSVTSPPSNYQLMHDIRQELLADGININVDTAKVWLADWEMYRAIGCSSLTNSCEFVTTGDGTRAPETDLLQGRRTAVPPASHYSGLNDIAKASLRQHNILRARGGILPLTWNAEMATVAEEYAHDLCRDDSMEHSYDEKGWGENIYAAIAGGGEDKVDAATHAVRMANSWYNEVNWYRYGRVGHSCTLVKGYVAPDGADSYKRKANMTGSNVYGGAESSLIPESMRMIGHFTLLMNARATTMGCAVVQCADTANVRDFVLSDFDRFVGVCRYDSGNTVGSAPFSPRTAMALVQDRETLDVAQHQTLCHEMCDAPLTDSERAEFSTLDDAVTLVAGGGDVEQPPSTCTEEFPDPYKPL